MATIDLPPLSPDEQTAWNQAHDRLAYFLNTFALGDSSCVSRLTLSLLDEARELHRKDPSQDPTTVTMEQAQKLLTEWLGTNLEEEDRTPSHILADGYIALLLSGMSRTAPNAFLASTLSENQKHSMRQTLVITGPDLNISSMTPRPLDFGPMLHFARQTWHRWDGKEILFAILFWACVYTILYWSISQFLL